ncbi:MAG TPA: hypothetical protein VMQ54_11895 [Steroidobacteraceae bacterium]|nr:hypothetical protein [Steroidobacteraceae bacterium]
MRFPGALLFLVCLGPILCRAGELNLATLSCDKYENEVLTAADSINTVMWLFGYSVGQSGSHLFDAGGLTHFASALQNRCAQHPDDSLFDGLAAVNKPAAKH